VLLSHDCRDTLQSLYAKLLYSLTQMLADSLNKQRQVSCMTDEKGAVGLEANPCTKQQHHPSRQVDTIHPHNQPTSDTSYIMCHNTVHMYNYLQQPHNKLYFS